MTIKFSKHHNPHIISVNIYSQNILRFAKWFIVEKRRGILCKNRSFITTGHYPQVARKISKILNRVFKYQCYIKIKSQNRFLNNCIVQEKNVIWITLYIHHNIILYINSVSFERRRRQHHRTYLVCLYCT